MLAFFIINQGTHMASATQNFKINRQTKRLLSLFSDPVNRAVFKNTMISAQVASEDYSRRPAKQRDNAK